MSAGETDDREYKYEFAYEGEIVKVGTRTEVSEEGIVNQSIHWETGEWSGDHGYIASGRMVGPYLVFGVRPSDRPTHFHNGSVDSIEIPEAVFNELREDQEKDMEQLREEARQEREQWREEKLQEQLDELEN